MKPSYRDSKGRFVKRPSIDSDNKGKFINRSATDVYVEPSKTLVDTHVKPLKPEPDNLKTVLYALFMFIFGPIMMVTSINYSYPPNSGIVMCSIIIYIVIAFGCPLWFYETGYWKHETKEEKEARKEAIRRKWDEPIKSAHIIRLERGLYTGLGNRRPWPAGRRIKKY